MTGPKGSALGQPCSRGNRRYGRTDRRQPVRLGGRRSGRPAAPSPAPGRPAPHRLLVALGAPLPSVGAVLIGAINDMIVRLGLLSLVEYSFVARMLVVAGIQARGNILIPSRH